LLPQALEKAVLRGVGDLSEGRGLELSIMIQPIDPLEGRIRQGPAVVADLFDGGGFGRRAGRMSFCERIR
jgi:hypothetical protein